MCEVLGAVVVARGPSGQREIGIDEFMVGPYETALAHNEMLIEVRIPLRHNTSSAYAKVERRVGDWAVAAAGSAVTLDGDQIAAARVGLTAVNADSEALGAVTEAWSAPRRPRETSPRPAAGRRGLRAGDRSARHRRVQAAPGLRADRPHLRTAVHRVRNIPAPKGN